MGIYTLFVLKAYCTTHWVVTEDDKIQAQVTLRSIMKRKGRIKSRPCVPGLCAVPGVGRWAVKCFGHASTMCTGGLLQTPYILVSLLFRVGTDDAARMTAHPEL